MLHVPSNSILTAQPVWMEQLDLPRLKKADFKIFMELQKAYQEINSEIQIPSFKEEFPGAIALSQHLNNLDKELSNLSFINYLTDRVLNEIEVYVRNGVLRFKYCNAFDPVRF